MLPAGQGDFFIIEFGEKELHYILIDGGDKAGSIFYKYALTFFAKNNKLVDAIIFTHIDDDHICGALSALHTMSTLPPIHKIYLNTGMSIEQRFGISIEKEKPEMVEIEYLHKKHKSHGVAKALSLWEWFVEQELINKLQPCVKMGDTLEIGEAKLKIISPGERQLLKYLKHWKNELEKEQNKGSHTHAAKVEKKNDLASYIEENIGGKITVTNASSIAFIFEYEDYKLAFLGDADPSVCAEGIMECYKGCVGVNLIKVPHHGSAHNYSEELYTLLNSQKFLLSTNGKNNKPHPFFLAKLFEKYPNAQVFCNMPWFETYGFTEADKEKYLLGDNPNIILLKDKILLENGLCICGDIKSLGTRNS